MRWRSNRLSQVCGTLRYSVAPYTSLESNSNSNVHLYIYIYIHIYIYYVYIYTIGIRQPIAINVIPPNSQLYSNYNHTFEKRSVIVYQTLSCMETRHTENQSVLRKPENLQTSNFDFSQNSTFESGLLFLRGIAFLFDFFLCETLIPGCAY